MTVAARSLRIPAESTFLNGVLRIPGSPRGVIVVAHAGANDSYAAQPGPLSAALERRGYATLTVSLLTSKEEDRDRPSGRHHLDTTLLAARLCLVLGAIRCDSDCRHHPVGLLVEGMAAAGAMTSASHHKEVRAIVCWNGRADLAGNVLKAVTTPTLLLTASEQPHLLNLNRKAAAALVAAINTLEVVDAPVHGPDRDGVIGNRAANWFDAFVAFDGARLADEAGAVCESGGTSVGRVT